MKILSSFLLIFFCTVTYAQDQPASSKVFGDYTVHYSVFNSLFIQANIAELHKLTRGKNQTLINIAIIHTESGKPVAAEKLSGTATNLMQQQKNIKFKPIKEPNALYYIGALKHTNEEVFHLRFEIHIEGETSPIRLKISKKLYTEP